MYRISSHRDLCVNERDLFLPGFISVDIARYYLSTSAWSGLLGRGWRYGFEMSLKRDADGGFQLDAGHDLRLNVQYVDEIPGDVFSTPKPVVYRNEDSCFVTQPGELIYVFDADKVDDPRQRAPLSKVLNSTGDAVTLHYDFQGRLNAVTDTVDRRIVFDVDRDGRVRSIQLESDDGVFAETVLTYDYNDAGDLVSVRDRGQTIRTFAYSDHLLVDGTDRLGESTFVFYGADRKVLCVSGQRNDRARCIEFDPLRMRMLVTNSLGYAQLYTLDSKQDVVSIEDAYGNVKSPQVMVEAETAPEAEPGRLRGAETNMVDSVRTASTVLSSGNVLHHRWLHAGRTDTYDALGRLNTLTCDIFGQPVELVSPLNGTFTIGWNAWGYNESVRYPDGTEVRMQIDPEGRLRRIEPSGSSQLSYEYDGRGRCTRFTDEHGREIRYAYNSEGELTTVVNQKGESCSISYDGNGRVTSHTEFDGTQTTYTYAGADTVPGGAVSGEDGVHVRRDVDGRPIHISATDRAAIEIERDERGRQIATHGPGAVELGRQFDRSGRITKEVTPYWQTEFEYDGAGRCRVAATGNTSIHYDYDARGRPVSTRVDGSPLLTMSYDLSNNVVHCAIANGTSESMQYDLMNRIVGYQLLGSSGKLLDSRRFRYGEAGRLREVIAPDGVTTYVRDTDGRIREVRRNGRVDERYRYDATGNLEGTAGLTLRYGSGDRIVAAGHSPVDHDRDGNAIRLQVGGVDWTLSYSSLNHLARAAGSNGLSVDYEYDLFGRRIRALSSTGEERVWVWNGNTVWQERISNGDEVSVRSFHYQPGSFIPVMVQTERDLFHIQTDTRGCPLAVWDQNEVRQWSLKTTIWGQDLEVSGAGGRDLVPMRLLGQLLDPYTGLIYNRYRYYWPEAARFITHDPLGIWGGTNLYTFAPDPYAYADPFGLQAARLVAYVDCTTVNPCPATVRPQDTAVVGNQCPAPLPFTSPTTGRPRGGGGTRHNQCCEQWAQNMSSSSMQDVRVNQRQGSFNAATGLTDAVGINRPDVSFFNPNNGRQGHIEFDQPGSGRGPGHAARLCDNDCDGEVWLASFSPGDTGSCV